jgi:hypothetical protein
MSMAMAPLLTAVLLAGESAGGSVYQRIHRFCRRLELKESPAPPAWYRGGEPRFRFVQITDVHLNPPRERLLREACAFVNGQVKPAFVILTGDNAGSSRAAAQQHLHDLLTRSLEAPFFVIRGDNWPQNLTGVFGSFQWSFDLGGVHFVASGLDVDVADLGIGRFLPETWTWLEDDLKRNAHRPIVYFQHEPTQPPTFLDAPRLDRLFEASPGVVLTMTGHLHLDIESRTDRVVHIVGPALGPSTRHGFKVVEVYPDQFVVRTVERVENAYRFVNKYQRVPLPAPFSRTIETEPVKIRNLIRRPARATTFDRSLLWRQPEIGAAFAAYAGRIGLLHEFFEDMGAKLPAVPPAK